VEWVYEGERFEGRGGSAGVLVDVLLAVPVRRYMDDTFEDAEG
jgi:hypothetical protein